MPECGTHWIRDEIPASFDELQRMLRPRERYESWEAMLDDNAGWVVDPDSRYGSVGTEMNKLVFLVRYNEEERAEMDAPEMASEIVSTVTASHNPVEQAEWHAKGYRILSDKHIYAKNVIMTLVKKEGEG